MNRNAVRVEFKIDAGKEQYPYTHPAIYQYIGCATLTPNKGGHHLKAAQFPAARYVHASVKPGDKEAPVVLVAFSATMVRKFSLKACMI